MNVLLAASSRLLRVAWSHRFAFAVPVATLLLPAAIWAVHQPDVYTAEAIVQVQSLQPENIGGALPQETAARPDELLPTIRDRLFSRPNLVATLPLLAPGASPDDARRLEGLAKSFQWRQVGYTAFGVGLQHVDPAVAAKGVNELLRAFLESERAERLRRAERNQAFHEQEFESALAAHRRLTDELDALRAAHADSLPERKSGLEMELRRVEAETTAEAGVLAAARARVQALDEQIAALVTQAPAPGTPDAKSAEEEAVALRLADAEKALGVLKDELQKAEIRYTDKHPDVLRLRASVANQTRVVEAAVADLDRVRKQSHGRALAGAESQRDQRRESLDRLRDSAATAQSEAEAKNRALAAEADRIGRALQEVPATELAMRPLAHDLDEAAKRLESFRRDAAAARAAADFYRSGDLADVTSFHVSAWAVPPVEPSGPGRVRLLATAIGLGLLAGWGLLVLRRRLEGTVVWSARDLDGLLPGAVVVSVPRLGPGRRSRRGLAMELGATLYVSALLGATAFLLAAHKGWLPAPSWLESFLGGRA